MSRSYVWMLAVLATGCRSEFDFTEIRRLVEVDPVVDVGEVAVGEALDFDVVIRSVSGGDVEVGEVRVDDGPFAWDGALPFIPADGADAVRMTFAPLEPGYHLAGVTIASTADDPGLETLVRGRAIHADIEVWPQVLDFGPVPAPDYRTESLFLTNGGKVEIELSTHEIDAPFVLATALPLSVAPGETVELQVLYNVVEAVAHEGVLRLQAGELVDVPEVGLLGNACALGDPALYDADGDGVTSCGGDCDDGDPEVRPGALETFDLRDEDCDGDVDEGTEGYDDDGDGASELEGDCNDDDPAIGPDVDEEPGNGIDDDCDGSVDAGSIDGDADGYAPTAGDCDDADASVRPGARELPDDVDNDCDGRVDEGTVRSDDDGDGFCEGPDCVDGLVPGDCDDSDPDVHPDAAEQANWLDDDCDGDVDEDTDNDDSDGDGYSEAGGDCDDANPAVHPGKREVPGNGVDEDCDGVAE